MRSDEEKKLRQQLRDNKAKRVEVKAQFDTVRAEKIRLRDERVELLAKAEKMGMKIGQKKKAAA